MNRFCHDDGVFCPLQMDEIKMTDKDTKIKAKIIVQNTILKTLKDLCPSLQ